MISAKQKCIFVHIPKTGGQSTEQVFLTLHGLTWEERSPLLLRPNNDPKKGPDRLAHLLASEYVGLGYVAQRDFDSYFKFSFVRNPWDRLVSAFHFINGFGLPFNEFVKTIDTRNRLLCPQYQFLLDARDNHLVDFIGRFENIKKDFQYVCEKIGISKQKLPRRNVSVGRRAYHHYYDDETRELVAKIYRRDIDLFEYRFESQ